MNHFSAHRVYARNGDIYHMVDIRDTAWHAGNSIGAFPSFYIGYNYNSVGHELIGMSGEAFTEFQYRSLAWQCYQDEKEIWENKLGKVKIYLGHDWISGEIAVRLKVKSERTKKIDPGPLFDYQKFYQYLNDIRIKELTPVLESKPGKVSLSEFKTGELWSEVFKRFTGGKK